MKEEITKIVSKHLKGKNAAERVEKLVNELLPLLDKDSKPASNKVAFGVVMTEKASTSRTNKETGQDGFLGRPSVV